MKIATKYLPIVFINGGFISMKNNLVSQVQGDKFIEAIRRKTKNLVLTPENDADNFLGTIGIFLTYEDARKCQLREKAKSEINLNFRVGVEAKINSCRVFSDGTLALNFQGIRKINFLDFSITEPYFMAKVEPLEEYGASQIVMHRLRTDVGDKINRLAAFGIPKDDWLKHCLNRKNDISFTDSILHAVQQLLDSPFSIEEMRQLTAELSVSRRLQRAIEKMDAALILKEAERDINSSVKASQAKQQREYVLRQQKEHIIKELAKINPEEESEKNEAEKIKEKIDAAGMPPEAEKAALKALEDLKLSKDYSQNADVLRTYLGYLTDYPWNKRTEDNYDLENARKILDEDHYGLEKVKKRVLEFLAVRKLNPGKKGAILCLDGPPGTGKTSIAKSIARALGRRFERISLGGIDDEAKIRGHRRTYVGALPGCIVKAMIKAGVANPVIDLDEVDKIRSSLRGNPSAALLEALDPEQNYAFSDHYFGLGAEIDLSQVIFVCTSNYKENILPTLRDRLEFIDFPGYTRQEKLQIAKRHLLPKQIKENGLENFELEVPDETIMEIITKYTREAGVRTLERTIADILRTRAVAAGKKEDFGLQIVPDELNDILGPVRFEPIGCVDVDEPGVITGLAWTQAGGDTLIIESCKMKKKGKVGEIQYTGHLGPSMKESVEVAFTCARRYLAKLGVDTSDVKEKYDIHLHVPAGAVSKDGPSAGGAMAMVLISLLSGRRIWPDLAMTGEIALREGGIICPIGGVKEKLLAAHQAGYRRVIIPKKNERHLVEVPEEVKRDLEINLVSHLDEVAKIALIP